MKIHREIEQNSLDWLVVRAGKLTASEAGNILTPQFKARTGDMVESYLAAKAAELWLGGPLPGFGTSFDMDSGKIIEETVLPWLRFSKGIQVEKVGFIDGDDERIGCSPDGVVLDGDELTYGIEIKAPQPKNHVRYLLAGDVPEDYRVQVHYSMFVTGAPAWMFVSYHRRFPALTVMVKRDPQIQIAIAMAVTSFLPRLKSAFEKLEQLNGGLPERFTKQPQPEKSEEYAEGITP